MKDGMSAENTYVIEQEGTISLVSSKEKKHVIRFGELDGLPSFEVDFSKIRESEDRLPESKNVNPITYPDLEYAFNEGYRNSKALLTDVTYAISKAKARLRQLRSEYLLDEYPSFLKEKGLKDNAANREAFLERKRDYVAVQNRLDQLVALESFLEGKIKVFENASRFMRKQMDLIIRSGMDPNKYVR